MLTIKKKKVLPIIVLHNFSLMNTCWTSRHVQARRSDIFGGHIAVIEWTYHDLFLSNALFIVAAESRMCPLLHLSLHVIFSGEIPKNEKSRP